MGHQGQCCLEASQCEFGTCPWVMPYLPLGYPICASVASCPHHYGEQPIARTLDTCLDFPGIADGSNSRLVSIEP